MPTFVYPASAIVGRLGAAPRLAPRVALLGQPSQAVAEKRHAPAREPAVGLELALAGAPRPHPAAEPLEVLPESAHARKVVLELGQLDLELALGADGVLGEDVEDQLRPVDHARLQRVLERLLLHRRELVVHDQRLGARALERLLQLLELAFADVGARVWPLPVLDELGHRLDSRRPRELAQLGENGVDAFGRRGEHEPALGLGTRRRIGLSVRHAWIMPLRNEDSIRRAASSRRLSGTVSESRTKPSPLGPKDGPGEMTTPACSSTSSVNEAESWPSGTRTQKYGVACGGSTSSPIADRASASRSRRRS